MPENRLHRGPQAYATLRIFGPHLDPAEVTRLLGLGPTNSHRAGDPRPKGGAPYREGLWSLCTEGSLDSSDLDEHLRHLLERFEGASPQLRVLLAQSTLRGDVFCFLLRDRADGGPTISSGVQEALGHLGLPLALNIYGPFEDYTGRPATKIRSRQRRLLNAALRRPGMYGGELAIMGMLSDLAWTDRQEHALARFGELLVARSMWTSTGVVGAFERLAPTIDAQLAAASVFAEIARRLGWLEVDQTCDAATYWKIVNSAPGLVADRDLTLEDIEAAFGPASVRIGGSKSGAYGYTGPEERHTFLWFHAAVADPRVVCCRRDEQSFVDSVTFTPLGRSVRHSQPYPTDVLRGVPPPFEFAQWSLTEGETGST